MSQSRIIVALLVVNIGLLAVILLSPPPPGPRKVERANAPQPDPVQEAKRKLATVTAENVRLDRELEETRRKVDAAAKEQAMAHRAVWPPSIPAEHLTDVLGHAKTVRIGLEYLKAREAPKFAAILSGLRLTDAQFDQTMEVLADRAASDLDLANPSIAPTPLDRAERDRRNAELLAKLTPIVGPGAASALVEAEKRVSSQSKIQQIADQLAFEGEPMTEPQRKQIMAQWRAVTAARPNSEADVDATVTALGDRNQQVMDKARNYLSPSQLAALSGFLARDVSIERANLLGEALGKSGH